MLFSEKSFQRAYKVIEETVVLHTLLDYKCFYIYIIAMKVVSKISYFFIACIYGVSMKDLVIF